MASNQSGQALETYLIDLALRTEGIKGDVDTFLKQLETQLDKGTNQATDKASKNFAGMGAAFTTTLQSMVTTAAQTKNPVAALTSGLMTFNGAIQAAAAGGAAWATALGPVVAILSALVTVLAVVSSGLQTVIGFLSQTADQGEQLAARVQTLNTGLTVVAQNAGISIDMVTKKISQLQASGITTQASMESLLKFMSQGLPIDNIEKLSRAAQDMAVAFGQNSSETFDRFVYAIMTGNSQLLRFAGIMTTVSQMQDTYANTLNKNVNSLTDLEKRQAIVNGIIQASAGYTGLYEQSLLSLGKRIQSLPRYIEEGTLAFGETMTPALDLATTATETFWKQFQKLFEVMQTVEQDGVLKQVPIELANGTFQLTPFGQKIKDIAQGVEDTLLPIIKNLIAALPGLTDNFTRAMVVVNAMITPVKNLGVSIDIILTIIKNLMALVAQLYSTLLPGHDLFTDLTKSIEGWVMMLTFALSAVNSGLVGLDQMLKGEATTAWTDWAKNAKQAVQEVKTAMEPTDVSKMTPQQMAAAYKAQTGRDPFDTVRTTTMNGWALPTTTSTQTRSQDFLKWIQANGENPYNVGEEDKRGAGTPAKPKTDVDEEALAKTQKAIQEGGREIADSFTHLNDQITKSNEQFYGANGPLAKFALQVTKQEQQLSDSLTKALQRTRDALIKAEANLEIQYGRALEAIGKQANKNKEDENKRFHDQQIADEDDFQTKMKRMQQDYSMNLDDAIQARDAKAILQLMRQHAVQVQRANEDHNKDKQKKDDEHQDNLEKIDKDAEDQRQRLKEAHDQQLQDMKDQEQEQEDQQQQAYRDQMAELIKNADEQRQTMIDAHDQQLQDMKDAQKDQLKAMVEHWADVGDLDSTSAEKLLHLMDGYYGADGKIESLITAFVARNQRNEAITITLNDKPVTPILPGAGQAQCPPGQSWSYIAGKCVPNEMIGHGFATGGAIRATRPTTIRMAESGIPETAVFLPDDARMSLSEAAGAFGGGPGGGGSSKNINISMKIDASGTITPEFADAILGHLGDVILEALPNARLDADR